MNTTITAILNLNQSVGVNSFKFFAANNNLVFLSLHPSFKKIKSSSYIIQNKAAKNATLKNDKTLFWVARF